jgi:hypothetical protein
VLLVSLCRVTEEGELDVTDSPNLNPALPGAGTTGIGAAAVPDNPVETFDCLSEFERCDEAPVEPGCGVCNADSEPERSRSVS